MSAKENVKDWVPGDRRLQLGSGRKPSMGYGWFCATEDEADLCVKG